MTVQMAGVFLRRWWLLLVLLPLLGAAGGYVMTRTPFYTSTLRATVLLPGDTEDTGSAERPELMILDDVPTFVQSTAFAQFVHDRMEQDKTGTLTVGEIRASLTASRYSRVVTIVASNRDAATAQAIAQAAADVLPEAVNSYLIADGGQPATVRLIDPASDPVSARMNRSTRMIAQMAAAFVLALVVALMLETVLPSTGASGKDQTG